MSTKTDRAVAVTWVVGETIICALALATLHMPTVMACGAFWVITIALAVDVWRWGRLP